MLYVLFRWYRNGNRIIVHKPDGKVVDCGYILGINIKFYGKNSTFEIFEPVKFKRKFLFNPSKVQIKGDNSHICIYPTDRIIYDLQIVGCGSNNELIVGKNWYQNGKCTIDFCCLII